MRLTNVALALAAAGSAVAQRPSDTPICDFYTTALLKNNTAENQLTLLTLLVNTVVIGNYTMPNVGISVPGILAKGTFKGTEVNLLPFFNGDLKTTNRGGDGGVSVNFLDGGGAEPLKKNMPAADTTSNQYFLLTHLYQFFGALLGCTQYGKGAFPAYSGEPSMFQVHSFMGINESQLGYFIQQVALAAASFGVTQDDLMAVGTALNDLFGMRCSPPATAIPEQGPQLHAICIADTCPLAPSAACAEYKSTAPNATATSTRATTGTATGTVTGGSTAPPAATTTPARAGAAATGVSLVAVVGAFAALLL